MRISVHAACLVFCVLLSRQGWSQGKMEFRTPGSDSVRVVFFNNADTYRFEQKDSVTGLTFLVGHVVLQEKKTLIYCDSMISNNKDNYIECFGHVHINDNDSMNIFSDYMKYFVDKKNILFQKNVKLTDGKGVLTTQELQYDLNQKVGVYNHGGKVVNKGSVLTSEEGTYYETTRDVYFRKNVVLRDPQYDLSADSLLYNTQSQVSTFITETYIVFKDSTHRTVRTREGFYDLKNRKAQFGKRPVITDGPQRITGDDVQFDDSTGISTARGNAIYKDTTQGAVIIANFMISDKKKGTFLATQKPLMILKQEKDSIYIAADTLFSGRLSDMEAAIRNAAIAGSLHKHYVDSLYRRSSDSLHLIAVDSLHRGDTDTLEADDSDSSHRVIVKDESHKINSDSLKGAAAERPPGAAKDSLHHAVEEKLLAPVRDSLKGAAANIPSVTAPSGKARKTDTTGTAGSDSSLRYIKGYGHVRIFSDSLQAVADSLFYSGKDSIFRLFKDPIAWGNGNYQVTGDTMFVFTKNKKAERLYVFENALAINKVGRNFYNQIKGITLNAYFKDGVMDFMRAKGNAESIYYVRDDTKAYTGVNKAHADIIDMIFLNKELNRVVLRNNAEGSMIPFKKVNFDDMRLRGFKWLEDKRPKTKFELFQ